MLYCNFNFLSVDTKAMFKLSTEINGEVVTVPKKNASISISFLPTSCRFAKVLYFYVGKKEYSISATNKLLYV